MLLTVTNEQKIQVGINPTTASGNPAEVENPLFEIVSGDATIEVIDEKNIFLVSGEVGSSQLRISGDADLGAGVVTLEDTVDLTVIGAQAAGLGITIGEPIQK